MEYLYNLDEVTIKPEDKPTNNTTTEQQDAEREQHNREIQIRDRYIENIYKPVKKHHLWRASYIRGNDKVDDWNYHIKPS